MLVFLSKVAEKVGGFQMGDADGRGERETPVRGKGVDSAPKSTSLGFRGKKLTLKSSHIPAVSAVVAADSRRLDGGMET